ncbi:MAG: carboxypeptidase-like regulatory domain-containing protein [Candidatus Binatus sp.]|uniref:carboxypeptidase-like regulatory domain-containing protein n=1 Tax=Candidatus Binatus sp. TaxID=2811406 RepID=UPI00271993E4|nr:carboxypeptidase-like regulatory domain-containing protein [Candidatus Binatus sp.]MDO8431612.1 carboxypeptidase-like regulatory domain-containing protein [Candidatus Binatus sp.]
MKNLSLLVLGVAAVGGIATAHCFAAEVVGRVADAGGAPIAGVAVAIKNPAGIQIGSALSDSSGRYAIHDLAPGIYTFMAGGQTAVSYVDADGLTVDWGIAPSAPAIAIAHRGIAPNSDQTLRTTPPAK